MGLLTKDERNHLIELLLELPNIHNPSVRHLLEADLPRNLRHVIPFDGSPGIHIANIVNTVDADAWEPLPDRSWPILLIIEQAAQTVRGSRLEVDLERLLTILKNRTRGRTNTAQPNSVTLQRAVIMTALPVEYKAVAAHLMELREDIHPQGTIYQRGLFRSNNGQWDVWIAEVGAGNNTAAFQAERAVSFISPAVMLFIGVAGGIKDVAIGDVVAATKVYGYESGKVKHSFEPRPSVGTSSFSMEQRARAESKKSDWLRRLRTEIPSPAPQVFVAPIAAGEKVIASARSEVARFVRQSYGDAIAVEMEGRGFLEAARANQQVQALIIRGISDLLSSKAPADAAGSQELASRHASAFGFEVLAKLDGG